MFQHMQIINKIDNIKRTEDNNHMIITIDVEKKSLTKFNMPSC
jgi:phage regulator Rha-like protein